MKGKSLFKTIEIHAIFKVLRLLVEKPKKYSVREVARELEISPNTASYCLHNLFGTGILKHMSVGRASQYELNNESVLLRHIKKLRTIDELASSGILGELKKKEGMNILSITLYGSCARGADDPKSDIDLLVVSTRRIKLGEIKSEKKIKRECNITNYTWGEWRKKAQEDKVFYEKVITDGEPLLGELPIVK